MIFVKNDACVYVCIYIIYIYIYIYIYYIYIYIYICIYTHSTGLSKSKGYKKLLVRFWAQGGLSTWRQKERRLRAMGSSSCCGIISSRDVSKSGSSRLGSLQGFRAFMAVGFRVLGFRATNLTTSAYHASLFYTPPRSPLLTLNPKP